MGVGAAWVAMGLAWAVEPDQPPGAIPISLPQAIEEALSANLELRREAIAVGLADAALVRARGRWDPTLSLSTSTSTSRAPNNDQNKGDVDVLSTSSNQWSASVSQALPTGGQLAASWSERRSSSDADNLRAGTIVSDDGSLVLNQPLLRGFGPAALWDQRQTQLSVTRAQVAWRAAVEQAIIDVSAAYWRLVAADQRLALAEQSRAIAEGSVDDMEERFAAGFVGTGDVLQMQRAFGAAQQREVGALADRQDANNDLCRLLGRDVRRAPVLTPSDTPVVPDGPPDPDRVLAQAFDNNARFRQATLDLRRAELSVKRQRNQALPDLAINGSFTVFGQATDAPSARRDTLSGNLNSLGVGASIAVPLLGRSNRADLAEAKLNAEDARLARVAAEQDLVLRVQDALRFVERDQLQVELATETERVAALALQADQELLAEGRGSSRNVAQSLELLQQAGVDLLQARIGLQASLLELQRVTGTLVAPADLPDPASLRFRTDEPR